MVELTNFTTVLKPKVRMSNRCACEGIMLSFFSPKQFPTQTRQAPFSVKGSQAALLLKLKQTKRLDQPSNSAQSLRREVLAKAQATTVVPFDETRTTDLRASFLRRLKRDSMQYLCQQHNLHQAASQEERALSKALTSLMGAIYQHLDSLAFDFNESIGWSGLQVTGTSPELVTEVLHYNKLREATQKVTHLRARFSTRHTSLVIRASKNKIDFLLMPVEKVIGLSQAELAYTPIVTINGSLSNQEVEWEIEEKPLTSESMEILCLELFAKLIESTREELCKSAVA